MNSEQKSEKKTQSAPKSTRRSTAQRRPTPPKLKLLISVVPRTKSELYLALLQDFDANMQLSTAAKGTAKSEMLQYLGLTNEDKAVIFSVIRADKADGVLRFLDEKFSTIKNGKGVAFTVPLSSVIGVAIYQFLSNGERR